MAWESSYIEENENDEERIDFWEPEPSNELQGTVIKRETGFYGKQILYIKTEDDEELRTKEAGGLSFQIEKMDIKEGDIVHILYKGLKYLDKTDDEGNPLQVHDYKLSKWVE